MLPKDAIRQVSGYGMSSRADGYVVEAENLEDIQGALKLARETRRPLVLRGAGRSYGDASILSEGIVLDLTQMNRILAWDPERGEIECEPGVTIEDLWRHCLPDGWWPPVVSGTMYVTLGGALAMNIHGKNNFRAGCIGEHVLSFSFLTADGEVQIVRRGDDLFQSVISSAGLLGVIVSVKVQMKKVGSGRLDVYAESVPNWEAQFSAFEQQHESADYMVSWVDCFARGESAGRGLFHAATHRSEAEPDTLDATKQDLPSKVAGVFPKRHVWRILRLLNNRFGMKVVNTAKYFSSRLFGNRSIHQQSLVGFSFLLDYVPDWRNAYHPDGFIQYQSFIPADMANAVFEQQIALSQEAGLEPFLGVLKRHRPDSFLFSHGVDGYSLALDYKVAEETLDALTNLGGRMNDLVIRAGGKFYLAKDSLLTPEDVRKASPDAVGSLMSTKRILDPENIFQSDLARRLSLLPGKLNP